MTQIRLKSIIIALTFTSLAISCAIQRQPTGGPRDETPPEVTGTTPESGSVNFSGDKVVFRFSEFMDRASIRRAIEIQPDIDLDYTIGWKRQQATVQFDDALPDSTTLIVTLGTDLKDHNGNAIAAPITLALSTGPTIDKGEIVAEVRSAETGRGIQGERVVLYERPVNYDQPAFYVTQTDTAGTARFTYLAPGSYTAFWLDDRNRNKQWDADIESAQPFPVPYVTLGKDATDTLGTVFLTKVDRQNPSLQGVGLYSQRRMRLRFSENIMVTDSTRLTIADTLGEPIGSAAPLYVPRDDGFVLFAHSELPLLQNRSYQIQVAGIADSSRNALSQRQLTFEGTDQPDTTLQRIVEHVTIDGIRSADSLELVYAKPITEPEISDSLIVVRGQEAITGWPYGAIRRNRLFVAGEEGQWEQGVNYQLRVWNPIVADQQTLDPVIWHEPDLGGFAFLDQSPDSLQQSLRLLLTAQKPTIRIDTTFRGEVELDLLPPVTYRVRIYEDRNGNGEWDTGSLNPCSAAAPWRRSGATRTKRCPTCRNGPPGSACAPSAKRWGSTSAAIPWTTSPTRSPVSRPAASARSAIDSATPAKAAAAASGTRACR